MHPLNQTAQISGHGCKQTAIMTDAILPFNGDKLSYNLVTQDLTQYDEITTTESTKIECDNTLVQEVLMWRNFNKWVRTVELESKPNSTDSKTHGPWWSGDSKAIEEANSIALYSLVTQLVLDGLMESIKLNGLKLKIRV